MHVSHGEPRKGFRPCRGPNAAPSWRHVPTRGLPPTPVGAMARSRLACQTRDLPGAGPSGAAPLFPRGRMACVCGRNPRSSGADRSGCVERWPGGRRAARRVDGSTVLWSARENLEGEQSPGRIGSRCAGNGASRARTSRRSNALKSRAVVSSSREQRTGNSVLRPGGSPPRQRQEGNGHGDVARLPGGNILRGVRTCAVGSMRAVPGAFGHGRAEVCETR